MILAGYVLSGLIAIGIIFIGLRFLWAPATASSGYGIAGSRRSPTEFDPWLAVKGLRDIASGFFIVLLMIDGSPRLLGEFLFVATLIPFGDAIIVLRSGGSRAAAFAIHGGTAVFIIATGTILVCAGR